jgi:transcription elongation factor GreA
VPEVTYLSRQGLEKLQEELRFLKSVERPKLTAKIAEARAHGDLSENAEYHAAKEEQVFLEMRIGKLEESLSRARLLDGNIPNDKIYILSTVKLRDCKTDKKIEYTLTAVEEANFQEKKISITSPIGKGLLGRKVGEVVEIQVPAGTLKYEVLAITRD